MTTLTYCFVDAEFDGPVPGTNSMLSFACAAFNEEGIEVDTFAHSLFPLDGAAQDPRTMAWWKTEPDAWAATQTDQVPPREAMTAFTTWVRALSGNVVFAAAPLMGDGLWLDYYLQKFTQDRIAMPFSDDPLFIGDGLDVMSYVQAALRLPHPPIAAELPPELLTGVNHTHLPLDDARGHANVFFNTRRKVLENEAS